MVERTVNASRWSGLIIQEHLRLPGRGIVASTGVWQTLVRGRRRQHSEQRCETKSKTLGLAKT
eukprot:7899906-Heterocapsa_arctica.AAC.1